MNEKITDKDRIDFLNTLGVEYFKHGAVLASVYVDIEPRDEFHDGGCLDLDFNFCPGNIREAIDLAISNKGRKNKMMFIAKPKI